MNVIVTCDPGLSLETRMELLSGAFVLQTQNGKLLAVEKWDIEHGLIQFSVKGKEGN